MAYDDEDEESFLATQQVDEARHMQVLRPLLPGGDGLRQER